MKTNILISTLIGFGKVISRTYSRSDSLSIVSRQSDLRTYSAESSCETFSVGQCSPHAFPFEAKSQLASSHQSVLAILVACLTVFGVGNAWGATYTFDFHTNTAGNGGAMTYWYSDAQCNTHVCKYYSTSNPTTHYNRWDTPYTMYYKDATITTAKTFVMCSSTGYYAYFQNGAYLIFGKQGSYLTLPTFPGENITNVMVTTNNGVASSVNVNVYSGTNAASTQQTTTGSKVENLSFDITSTYQGDELKIQVENEKNFQLTQIVITTAPAGYAITWNNGGKGTAPTSPTSATSLTLAAITGVTGWTCTGWKANVAVTNTSTSASISAGTLIPNGTNVTLSQATTFTAQWETTKYTVSFGVSPAGYGTVSQASVTNVPHGTVPTSSTNTITVNGTTVTATPHAQDADYNYAFSSWSGIPGTVTGAVTITANFTRTARPLTNYRTVCCTELGEVSGSASRTTPTTATLTWSNVTGAEKYQVKVVGSSSHNDWTDATSGVTVTGLTCGTAYTAYFRAIDTDDSHCSTGPESTADIPASSWTVTSTGVTNATASPAIPGTTCDGFNTTITAATGYALPSTVTVSGASHTWNQATGALSISTVTGDVTITVTPTCVEPVIGTDPADASYQQGASPSALTVAATLASGTLTYQWQKSTDGGSNWSNESGTGYNTATYAAANISTASVGTTKYRCIVGNSEGGCTVTSAVATITITAAANFVNDATVFIQAESSSAWNDNSCVKAWFNNNGAGGAAQATYWLFDATGNKKIYAAVVPASGNVNQVTLQRFASNCSDFWNNNGTLTKASDGGSNIFCTNGSGNSDVSWNGTGLTMSLMSSDAWLTPVATLTDQGSGVWTGTYEYTPSNTSTEYIVATNYNGNIGNTGNNSNATLSGMIVGSTYNVTATLNVISHSLLMSKTFVKGEVSFDLQGHGDAISKLTNVTNGSTIDAPSEPSATGYTFGGWFKEPACTNEWDFENDGVSETMTLYAKWTANVYTITKTFSNVANSGLPASFTYTGSTTTALNSTFTVNTTNFFLPSSITVTMGGATLTAGTDYTYNNSTGAFTFDRVINGDIVITASATAKLTGIEITTDPTKLIYLAGESFSSTGAVVTATMGNGDTKDVTASVTWTPAGALSAGTDQTVTATYTENGVEKTATTTINVYSVTVNNVNMSGTAIADANVTASNSGRTLSQSVGGTNYKFNSWEVTAGGVSVSNNAITGAPNANVVINAKFHDPITVTWKVGSAAAGGTPTTEVKYGTKVTSLPSTPAGNALASCGTGANTFMGWTAGDKIETPVQSAPSDLFNSTSDPGCSALTSNTTYRAVFASTVAGEPVESKAQTLQYDTWTYSGSTTNKTSYRLFGNNAYIESAALDLSKLSKVTISGGTFGGAGYNGISIKDADGNVWKTGTVSTSGGIGTDNFTDGNALTGTKALRIYATSGDGSSNGVRISQVEIYISEPTVDYANYITGCCTPLAAIGGAVEFSNPTTAVLTWNAMSNVDATTPYVVTYRTGSDEYGSSNVGSITTNGAGKKTCTITGLSCNTSYDFKIAVIAAEDYCDKEEIVTETSTKYSITKDVVTGGSCTTKISTDDVTEACNGATIAIAATPSAGYTFSSWTITKEGGGTVEPAASSASTSFTMPSDNVTVTPTFSCIVPNHIDITGRWDRFGGETISLTATAYATAGTGSPIPAADITGYQWQKWYNEQWNDVSDGGNISGTSTNNLVITNSIGGNSGSYRCVVTTGATCPAYSSDGREVKVFALECYTGGTTSYNFTRDGENERGSVEVTLAANTAYTFKIHADNVYYGNSGTVNEDVADWLCTIGAGNLTVNSGLGGTFTFTMDYSSAGSSSTVGDPEISVTYPRKTIYLTPGDWNADGAKFAFYYFRKENETIYGEGFTDFITAGDCGSSAEIPQWNGVKINAVRLNSNTTVEELTNPAEHYKAAWDKKWNQTSDITISNYNSITITGMGGGGDSPYDYGTYSVPTYTISYATGSTTYTGGNTILGSKANESKTCGEDFTLPNAAVFTTTGYTQTGWATSDGGSQAYAFGGSYATNAAQAFYPAWTANTHSLSWSANGGDALTGDYTTGTVAYGTTIVAPDTPTKTGYTFAGWHNGTGVVTPATTMPDNDLSYTAQWNLATYQVTLTTNGGTINAGNVTSYTYGTGATLPTNVTRDGYRFDGWFDNSGLTGDVVTTISSSATGDKAFWAKWTKIYTVTWHVWNSTWSVGEHNVNAGNTQVLSGEKIVAMPDEPANNTLNACANKFMGWSTHSWGSTPKGTGTGEYDDLFFDVANSPYINGTTHFYAVFAEEVNSGTYSDGTTHTWSGSEQEYSAWGGSATYSWLRNYTAAIPTHAYTPAYGVKKVVLNVRQSNTTGSNTVAVKIGGTTVGTTQGMGDGTSAFNMTFDHGTGTPLTGEVQIIVTNTSANTTGQGTFYLNTITLYEGTPDKECINYVTECADNQVRVTYDFNGGYGSACTEGVTTKTASYTVCSTTPTKDYYDFDGWNDGTSSYTAGATGYNLQATTTFTAQWTPTTYTIAYENMTGATNAVENVATYTIETSTITLGAPTRGHDRFEGWFTDDGVWSDEVTSIASGSHGNITLYAKWTTRHEIIFDYTESASSGTTTIWRADDEALDASVAGQGSVPSDPSAPGTCNTKVFVGWSKDLIDDETNTRPSDLMKPAAGTVDADKHYYAVWAIESSDIGPVTVFNDAFERVDNGTAYGNKGKYTTSYVFGTGTAGEARMSNSSSGAGSIDIDLSDKTLESTLTITFKLKYWTSGETGSVSLTCMDEGANPSFGSSPFAYPTTSGWHEFSSTVTGVDDKVQSINFGATAGKRVYIKDIVITQTGTVYNYSAYSTSCCATKVTLSQNSPANGTIAFGKASVGTCGGDKEVSLTITPAAGYQLATYSVATGDGKVATKTDPGVSLNNNSSAAQDITLTFASGANGAYDVTASFSEMVVTNWSWTNHDGGAALTTDPIEIYVDQQARVDVTYTPAKAELLSTHTAASYYNHDATGSAYVRNPNKASEYFTFYGKASTGDETTVITLTHNDDTSNPKTFPQLIYVKVLPMPLVHFVDLVHGETFANVVATLTDNALTNDGVGQTPTHSDVSDPGASYNSCERQHLHLVGWILSTWAEANPNAGNDAIKAAGAGNYYAAGADIDLVAQDGKTYYAVWTKIE